MLKNASSLAIVGLDTAENGPSKVRQVTNKFSANIAAGRARGALASLLSAASLSFSFSRHDVSVFRVKNY